MSCFDGVLTDACRLRNWCLAPHGVGPRCRDGACYIGERRSEDETAETIFVVEPEQFMVEPPPQYTDEKVDPAADEKIAPQAETTFMVNLPWLRLGGTASLSWLVGTGSSVALLVVTVRTLLSISSVCASL